MKRPAKGLCGFCQAALAVLVVVLSAETRPVLASDLSDWKPVAEGGAIVELASDAATPPDEQHTNSWRLTIKNAGLQAGMVSGEIAGANLQAGQWYDLTFKARTEGRATFALTVSLESLDGKKICARATLPEVGHQWADYRLALSIRQSQANCRLVITMEELGTIWLNDVSLVPRPGPEALRPARIHSHTFLFRGVNFKIPQPERP